ncbi:hypothetical protein F8G81_18185 [Arthrobacter sp. CDRTa11]|uniref:hypothetical protein n=1 Tax=Arthrobacter sp. CDRTa11 TaxID=2651199 RepID=UPI002265A11F|nr:hypothetical protein [Arthrobacter sp. CDRTa11]UZX04326.1 hypothetical protein F8G81_18185 [Arthrobacter sp. CDRTa11]
MSNNQQPGWPHQPNPQQPNPQQPQPEHGGEYPAVPQAPGQDGQQTQQFPPYNPQQPGQDGQYGQQPQPEYGGDYPTVRRYPIQDGQTQQFPPHNAQQPGQAGQPFYGDPAQQYPAQQNGAPYGQPGSPMYPPPAQKTGMPVWGWVASGAGALAVIAVAGVMVFNGLAGGKQPEVAPDPTASETAAPDETAAPEETADTFVSVFDSAGFDSAPVWSVQPPEGWAAEQVREGTMEYTNADLQCVFTTHQAILPPTGETEDRGATKVAMAAEIEGVKKSVGGPVEAEEKIGVHVKLRDSSSLIEMEEYELRFKNKSNADVVYYLALRATADSDGLMELGLACPGGMIGASSLWYELTDRVTMTDAP